MPRLHLPFAVHIALLCGSIAQNPSGPVPANPAPALPDSVRPIPPPGIEVPAEDRSEIENGLRELSERIAKLRRSDKKTELPNVEIFHKSADWALRYNEIFDKKQIATAKDHVKEGLRRMEALEKGEIPWNATNGLVVRGYRSEIDGSVQPYGLVITPPTSGTSANEKRAWPLHFWCHGRGEKLSELAFIAERQKSPGEFVLEGAIVCHLYGRYCNANKFAGERDLFEALDDIKQDYPIDKERLVIRGFSMGGAACWQFATHHSGMWAAAAPGAGFAETAEFFKVFAPGKVPPPDWEQKLWRWYDCTTMAANLANTTTVAYSGEKDGQKQAADIMLKYAEKEGLTFPHIIGPDMGHKYHPDSKPKINEIVDAAVAKGHERRPKEVRLVTYSLIYPEVAWVRISGMEKQWERAEVTAKWEKDTVQVKTANVTALELTPGKGPEPEERPAKILVDGVEFQMGSPIEELWVEKREGKWTHKYIYTISGGAHRTIAEPLMSESGLRKDPKICGPIDHAFMSSFVFVRPTGKPLNETVGAWTKAEFDHAVSAWRKVFRGDVRVVDDTKLESADIQNSNLVLWGDPLSNAVLKRILGQLPMKWDANTLELRGQKFEAAHHAPVMIYPNPLNPAKYVVLNSGFTFREFAALNNSDQTPKLPDWALVDLRTPPGPKWPGKIVDAGFFDEAWK